MKISESRFSTMLYNESLAYAPFPDERGVELESEAQVQDAGRVAPDIQGSLAPVKRL